VSAVGVLQDAAFGGGPDRKARRRDARRGLAAFRRFARFNRPARPRVALLEGHARAADGDLTGARRSWDRARAQGARLDMPIEIGLADLAEAASHPAASSERVAAAERAVVQLERIGAHRDAARARALLAPAAETGR
jgi:hypothetical protein